VAMIAPVRASGIASFVEIGSLSRLPQFLLGLAEGAGQLGEAGPPEEQQYYYEDDEQFGGSEVHGWLLSLGGGIDGFAMTVRTQSAPDLRRGPDGWGLGLVG